jgi:hypothetical protein
VAATVAQLVAAHAAARDRLSQAATGYAAGQMEAFTDWYDTLAIRQLAMRISGRVQAAQRQTAAVTDSYLARVLSALLGRGVPKVGTVPVTTLRTGVTPAAPYGRIADQYRYRRALDMSEVEAVELATERARVVANTDVSLAFRAQSRKVMLSRPVDGWRRIVHPELSRGGTCGLCIAASDRVYHRGDLMPLHARCECTVLPIVNGKDPGKSLDGAALEKLYAEAGSTAAAKLKRTRYVVNDHGELGPVLAKEGDHFRGPEEVPGSQQPGSQSGAVREQITPTRPPIVLETPPATFDERVGRALAGQDALDAAPLTMQRRGGELPIPKGPERDALRLYGSGYYQWINGGLRTDNWVMSLDFVAEARASIPHLDAVLGRSPLAGDTVVWRGSALHEDFFAGDWGGDLTGFFWLEKAYTSTSASRREAERFAGRDRAVVLRILLRQGQNAVVLSGMDTEAELLLPRGLQFRIVRDRGFDDRGRRLLDVEVV